MLEELHPPRVLNGCALVVLRALRAPPRLGHSYKQLQLPYEAPKQWQLAVAVAVPGARSYGTIAAGKRRVSR